MGKTHVLTLDVYRSSKTFPWEELYGLTSQMRRSSASIGANIAEGSCRMGDKEFGRFLYVAMGLANELKYRCALRFSNTCSGKYSNLPEFQSEKYSGK